MTPLAWFLGLFLPACGATGVSGLPPPRLIDISQIQRPSSPNTALAAPPEFSPKPDIVTPTYHVPAARLYADVLAVAAAQPEPSWRQTTSPSSRPTSSPAAPG
jgi:hypothetical protein